MQMCHQDHHLVDLNQTRPSNRSSRNRIHRSKRSTPLRNRCNRKSEQQILLERESGLESQHTVLEAPVLECLDDGQVLAVDEDETQLVGRVVRARVRRNREAELDVLAAGTGWGEHVERCEDGEGDGVFVRAGAGHDEGLEGREGEGARGCGQEGLRGGTLALKQAVEAVLFALLADDGADAADQAGVAVLPEQGLDVLQGAEDEVGEGVGEGDGVVEVGDWEDVFAGEDGAGVEVGEGAVGVERV